MDIRIIQKGLQWVPQALISWDGVDTPSWDYVSDLQEFNPSFDLGDKVSLLEGGNVTSNEYAVEDELDAGKGTQKKNIVDSNIRLSTR